MIKRISIASLSLVGLLAGSAYAAEGAGRYSGIAIGESSVSIDDTDFDESDTGYKLFGGYMFNKNFGLELAYIEGGSAELSGSGASLEVSPSAFTIEGVGRIPLGEAVAVYGKVGMAFYDADIEGRLLGLSFADSESGSEIIYGLGVSVGLGQKFELRAEWQQFSYEIDEVSGDFSMISLGGVLKF